LTQSLTQNLNPKLSNLIKHIFNRQLSTFLVILGRRGSGKTDFGFLICEILWSTNLIKHFASNTKVYQSPFPIARITNLPDLQSWANSLRGRKLFLFDEAGKTFRRRTPMSSTNIKLLDNLQILRKFKLSIILITPHEKFVDSAVLGSDVLDGVFIKPSFKNPKIGIYEDQLEFFNFQLSNIPRTSIKYDTWDVAPFSAHKQEKTPFLKDKHLQILWEWSHGTPCHKLNLHNQTLNRIVRKFVKETLEKSFVTSTKKVSEY